MLSHDLFNLLTCLFAAILSLQHCLSFFAANHISHSIYSLVWHHKSWCSHIYNNYTGFYILHPSSDIWYHININFLLNFSDTCLTLIITSHFRFFVPVFLCSCFLAFQCFFTYHSYPTQVSPQNNLSIYYSCQKKIMLRPAKMISLFFSLLNVFVDSKDILNKLKVALGSKNNIN